MKIPTTVWLTCVLLGAFATPAVAAPTLPEGLTTDVAEREFRYAFTPGEVVTYDATVAQSVGEAEGDGIGTSFALRRVVETVAVAPGGARAKLVLRYDQPKLTVSLGGERIDPATETKLAKKLAKMRATAWVTPRGERNDVAVQHISADVASLVQGFEDGFLGTTPTFPEAAIGPGDSWQETVDRTIRLGAVKIDVVTTLTTTLAGYLPNDDAVFHVASKIVVPATTVRLGDSDVAVAGSGSGDAVVTYDTRRRRVSSVDALTTQAVTTRPAGGKAAKGAVTMDVRTEARSSRRDGDTKTP